MAPLLILFISILLFRCDPAPQEVNETRLYMGTVVEITVLGKDREKLEAAKDAAFDEIGRIERLMSSYRDDSDAARIDNGAGGSPVVVDPEVYDVVARSVEISRLSDGAFDITMGALWGVWKIDPDHPQVGDPAEIAARLPLVSWKNIVLDKERHAVGLKMPGMKIDLGGIAKGYAVDRAIEVMAERGVTMALVDAGGDLRALGSHGGRPWMVGIQDPRQPGAIIGTMPVSDMSVATSGDYEKFIEKDGKRYCHIFDPRTGHPASAVRSATIITREAWKADALATSAFVLGPDQGMALIEKTPGVSGIIIDGNGKIIESTAVKGRVTWTK
ncbi:MAG TPA: FAD:protein FMN transferase [bacterium]|nr:FAD:protein FMN transferase [bacterium]